MEVLLFLPEISVFHRFYMLKMVKYKRVKTEKTLMAMTRKLRKNDCMILSTIEELVPLEHKVRKLERAIRWENIYPMVEHLYSSSGRPSIDPVVLFKMIIINYGFGINSMRRTCEEIKVNLAYRWFLGLSIDEKVPNYSTWSQNYIRRFGESEVFDQIFKMILTTAIEHGFVDTESVFGDSTHQKASANKKKSVNKEVEIIKKKYDDELLEEINRVRVEEYGQKPIKTLESTETIFDEETGEEIEKVKTKTIAESTTDKESGMFHKGEKEKCFAYSHQTFCDRHGYVLYSVTVPGNIHDSQSFFDAYEQVKKIDGIKNVVLDAGYLTPAICREIIESGKKPYIPYKRPMTKSGYLKKNEYVYDERYDYYLCPNDEELSYATTNKQGYKEYKSDPEKCKACALLGKCTHSKNHQKTITRHVWEDYKEQAEEIRYGLDYKDIYKQRKETIERCFADCKEKHGMRFTRVRGLKKNQHQALVIFSCHNLFKMSKYVWW